MDRAHTCQLSTLLFAKESGGQGNSTSNLEIHVCHVVVVRRHVGEDSVGTDKVVRELKFLCGVGGDITQEHVDGV